MSGQQPSKEPLMTREEWEARHHKYAEQFDRVIKAKWDIALRFIGFSVEYGKLALSYLVLVNGGGLVAIVTIQPMVKDTHQTWLSEVMGPAILFGVGLFLVFGCAAAAYHNHTHNGVSHLTRAGTHDLSLQRAYMKDDTPRIPALLAEYELVAARADFQLRVAYWVALGAGVVSGLCAAAGGVWLALLLVKG